MSKDIEEGQNFERNYDYENPFIVIRSLVVVSRDPTVKTVRFYPFQKRRGTESLKRSRDPAVALLITIKLLILL